jgi:hypothetical protein
MFHVTTHDVEFDDTHYPAPDSELVLEHMFSPSVLEEWSELAVIEEIEINAVIDEIETNNVLARNFRWSH